MNATKSNIFTNSVRISQGFGPYIKKCGNTKKSKSIGQCGGINLEKGGHESLPSNSIAVSMEAKEEEGLSPVLARTPPLSWFHMHSVSSHFDDALNCEIMPSSGKIDSSVLVTLRESEPFQP